LSRSRLKYFGVAIGTLAALFTIFGFISLRSLPKMARRILVAELEERFHSTIEIGEIQVGGIMPLEILARDITLRYHGRNDVSPLMTIQRLSGSASLNGLWGRKWRIASVHMEGLQIRIPPHTEVTTQSYVIPQAHPKLRLPPLEFDEITADNASLEILPQQSGRKPRSFWIHHLMLRSVNPSQRAYFHAELTNAIPSGEIESEGTFGPWNADQPSLTAVAANFNFVNANLGQLRGISGTLSSRGHYSGVLERLDVEGDASVPNFSLSVGGTPIALSTHYVAVVDGRNGNTYLKTVEAHFLRSALKVSGEIVDPPGLPQRRILLSVLASDARAEDLLRLVTKGSAIPFEGLVKLNARMELPAGSGDIVDRVSLKGDFQITRATFTNSETQARIDALSRRGQGQPKNEGISYVPSNIRGSLQVTDANAYFSPLEFAVPGASVSLKGWYGVRSEAIDFRGKLQLSSKLSQTTTGMKSALLRVLNPLFKDGTAGAVLPIKITGSRSNLSFGLDLGRHAKPA
jgi:hypothetical protein